MLQADCGLPEDTFYLDPDIIDLTMIPPPITPDEVRSCTRWAPHSTVRPSKLIICFYSIFIFNIALYNTSQV